MVAGLFILLFYIERFFKLEGNIYVSVEVLCVVIPTFMVCRLVYYSLFLLYTIRALDVWAVLTLKVVGSQWYWHYEFSDIGRGFNAVITPLEDLSYTSLLKNVNTTPVLILPQGVNTRACLTSSDVIHSWAIPSMGVKVDCNAGILNVVTFKPLIIGSYWGGCREICGVGHRMMPIHIEIVLPQAFIRSLLLSD